MLSSYFLLGFLLAGIQIRGTDSKAQVPETLLSKLEAAGTANVLIKVSNDPLAICNQAKLRGDSTVTLVRRLKAFAQKSQKPVLDTIKRHGVLNFKSYWITNRIYVPQCGARLLSELKEHSSITEITEELHLPLEPTFRSAPIPKAAGEPEWGVSAVRAPEVWETGNTGEGVIVANIDTGVLYTHEDLGSNYVGQWFDPGRQTPEPNDQNGHGTHTMGTIVGQNGIGVAPGAKWLACKGCQTSGCSESDLLSCGEYVVCPDGEENGCSMKPDVVSNSWGTAGYSAFYKNVVACWRAVNIVPIFANGNGGPACLTTGSPATYPNVLGVGAVDDSNRVASFSSRGTLPASGYDGYKPDLAAPGVSVTSAWNTGNTAYATLSGTSMAAPHVAGVVALMLSTCRQNRDYETIKSILLNGCSQENLQRPLLTCELQLPGSYTFPNSEYGMGLADALASASEFSKTCSRGGNWRRYGPARHKPERTQNESFGSFWKSVTKSHKTKPLPPSYIIPILPKETRYSRRRQFF